MGRNTGTGLTGHTISDATNHDGHGRRRRRRTRRARRAAALVGLAAVGASACSSAADDSTNESAVTEAPAEVEFADDSAAEPDAAPPPEGSTTAPGTATAPGLPIDNTFGRDLAIEMGLTMSTPDVSDTVQEINRLTAVHDGRVLNAGVSIEAPLEDGSVPGGGSMLIGIAPDDLPELVDALGGVARISNVEQRTEDVTEQLIDLEIRIRQARTGIASIEVLYGQATEFSELIEIEQELARRQIELERLLAAQSGVEGRVEMSRLTIDVEYEAPVAEETGEAEPVEAESEDRGIADAFREGWDAFAGVLFAIGFVLAVAAPFLALLFSVLVVSWLITRTRRRHGVAEHRPAPTPRPTGTAGGGTVDEPADLVGASHED